eukprot:SAG31_NODE_1590_length_7805_cov_3.417390_11_plen_60_part_01
MSANAPMRAHIALLAGGAGGGGGGGGGCGGAGQSPSPVSQTPTAPCMAGHAVPSPAADVE